MRRATGFRRGLFPSIRQELCNCRAGLVALYCLLSPFYLHYIARFSRRSALNYLPNSATMSRHHGEPAEPLVTPRPSFRRILPETVRGRFDRERHNREGPNTAEK